jgi:hypothetical protein
MSDPLLVRLAAAHHRLESAEHDAAALAAAQAERGRELAALDEQVDRLLARAGISTPALAATEPPPAVASRPAEEPADPLADHVATSDAFARGLEDDLAYLHANGIDSIAWEDLLDAATLADIDARLRRPVRAESMTAADVRTVRVCASLGIIAVLLDDSIDRTVSDRLCDLHDPASALGSSQLGQAIRQWDKDGKRLAIDYTGPGIGGPHGVHRVRSSGHDLLRPFSALRQIREGAFTGLNWQNNVPVLVNADRGRPEWPPYRQAEELFGANGAMLLWFKHLAADFTTDKSLPLPGATFLQESTDEAIRRFGAEAYIGGLNLRRVALSGALPVAVVELGVRSSVFIRAWQQTGSCRMTPERTAKLQNMLLLSHGLVAAASAGKVTVCWGDEGPAALRYLNPAAFNAAGRYAIPVAVRFALSSESRHSKRIERELAGGWDALATAWEFDAAVQAYERTSAASSLTL